MTGGELGIGSSPYSQSGEFYSLDRRHYGRDSSTLVYARTAPQFNPLLPTDYLETLREQDPEAYRSEVLGEFRGGVSMWCDPDAIDARVATWRELPPGAASNWAAFADFSSSRSDASVVSLAFQEAEHVTAGVVRAWAAGTDPQTVLTEAAALLKSYGCHRVVADRYAIGFVQSGLAQLGIQYDPCELNASRLYLELLPRILTGSVTIPNDAVLLRELRGLERRPRIRGTRQSFASRCRVA